MSADLHAVDMGSNLVDGKFFFLKTINEKLSTLHLNKWAVLSVAG